MRALAVCLLLLTMTTAALGDADPGTSHAQPSTLDHVYAKYAIKYLGLGDYAQQPSSSSKGNPIFHTVADQQGFTKYITYTSDGTNVYEVTVQMKPGSYPVIWSTPIKSKSDEKPSSENEVENIAKPTSGSKGENVAEDALPITFPPDAPEATTSHTLDNDSTEQPSAAPEHPHDEHHTSNGGKGPSATQEGSRNNMHRPAYVVRLPSQYFPGHYGPVSFYPVAYNPFTGQVKYSARPVNGALQPTGGVVPQGEKAGYAGTKTTLQPYTTTRPSPIPLGITPSGASIRVNPVSYLYPYLSYQAAKNSRVLYQVPTQQMSAIPSPIVQWVQAVPATRYQATYPQGYLSYQPAVSGQFLSALQNPQTAGQSATVVQTKSDTQGQK